MIVVKRLFDRRGTTLPDVFAGAKRTPAGGAVLGFLLPQNGL